MLGISEVDSDEPETEVRVLKEPAASVTGNLRIIREIFCPVGTTTVTYTGDTKLLAVGQENGSVQLFENGEPTSLLVDADTIKEQEPCTDIKIRASPKNGFHKNILVSYLDGYIKLWDTKLGKCLFSMREKRHIYGLDYHPTTSKFVTFGGDSKVHLYDEERRVTERILACSEIVGSKNGHTDYVCCAKFHPKNHFEIISSGFDGTIQFWDLRAPYAVRNIKGVVNYGEGLDISHDGTLIAAGISDSRKGMVRLYDYESGIQLGEHCFLNTYVYCCQFFTSSYVGIGGFVENSMTIGNMETGEVFGSVRNLPGCAMSFALKRKVTQQYSRGREMPAFVVSSAKKIVEVERVEMDEESTSAV